METVRYCIDTNVLIEPWRKYYSYSICPDYWDIIDQLGQEEIIFCTEEVAREIQKSDDDLTNWLKERSFLIRPINESVQSYLIDILSKFPRLVDTSKRRSMADPWVIAHAMAEDAVVVTKEFATDSLKKVKMPDVCKYYDIRCIDDHQLVLELGIKFNANRH